MLYLFLACFLARRANGAGTNTGHDWECSRSSRMAAADGTTKGVVTFSPNDFNCTDGLCSLDYANGQAASSTTKGFLTNDRLGEV